ncbi:hypothetical protein A8L45_14060 [Veronia pacifica]|uniref:Uncharacterized protein n=1 Tax=Veronia pacifica TaxID=1080227 RepID=A0A1C3EG32_9GAMM|nr:hypothetical protein A8L45_14060 [Veronia pacifica]
MTELVYILQSDPVMPLKISFVSEIDKDSHNWAINNFCCVSYQYISHEINAKNEQKRFTICSNDKQNVFSGN